MVYDEIFFDKYINAEKFLIDKGYKYEVGSPLIGCRFFNGQDYAIVLLYKKGEDRNYGVTIYEQLAEYTEHAKPMEIIFNDEPERGLKLLKSIQRKQKEVEDLSKKCRDMHYSTHSKSQIGKANANLNWACMELEKAKVDFSRFLEKSTLYVGSEERVMRPGGFHSYKH